MINPQKFPKLIAIASGKGGVGKSTVAVHLAYALKHLRKRIGILDADIYGPSLPLMVGVDKKPETNSDNKMIPLDKEGVKCLSMGFLINQDTPAIWRGPMIQKALLQFLYGADWGKTEMLIIDMPPGTGDVALTLAQKAPLTGTIVVSTPQDVALIDAVKAINMFRKVNTPILGIIENMSVFSCPQCHHETHIFSHSGVQEKALEYKIPFLGSLPLHIDLRQASDCGRPLTQKDHENNISKKFLEIAQKINEGETH